MKLSMSIIANLLEPFAPEVQISKESPRVLRSARLAHATDCVYVYGDGDDCVYAWEGDFIRVPELSAREGFELLQSIFDSMADWYTGVTEAALRRDYQRVVDLCYAVFKNPSSLSDGNHASLALSSQYGPRDVDEEWYHLKTYGYSSLESSQKLTEAQISYHFANNLVRYRFEEGMGLCSCLSAPVVDAGVPVGFFTVLERDHTLNYGHMQLLSLIGQILAPLLAQGGGQKDDSAPILEMLLSGQPLPRKVAQSFYARKNWSGEHTYRIIQFDFRQDPDEAWLRQNYFMVGSLAAVFPEDLCGMYQGKFVILANDTLLPQAQRRVRLERQLRSSDVKIATSLPFPGFRQLPELYRQVAFAMDYGGKQAPEVKFLDFYNYAIDYLLCANYSAESCLAACHPDVYSLYCMDEVLYRTLWVYLVQDRSVTKTIGVLFIHKNTLLHRLRRIEEILQHKLEDPYTRSYMRLSFLLLERHAGLSNPPETPFPPGETESE